MTVCDELMLYSGSASSAIRLLRILALTFQLNGVGKFTKPSPTHNEIHENVFKIVMKFKQNKLHTKFKAGSNMHEIFLKYYMFVIIITFLAAK